MSPGGTATKEIWIPADIEDAEVFESWLSGRKGSRVHVRSPRRGLMVRLDSTILKTNLNVLAIDRDEEKVKSVSDFVTYAVVLDAMDEKALRSVGIQNVDVAIVSIGEKIEASILVVMLLKGLGPKKLKEIFDPDGILNPGKLCF
jgi:hypothetical protein